MIRTTDADGNEVSKITPMMKANGTMETQTAPTFGRCPVEASCISYASRAEKSVRKLHDLPAAGVSNALMRRASCKRRFRVCHHARPRCRM